MKAFTDIKERYKPIPGFCEYVITECGEVYAYRDRPVGWKGLRRLSKKGENNPKRYMQVCLSNKYGKKYFQIHSLVANAFCDGHFDGAVVNHKDGNIHNNHYTNLEWVTQKENVRKSYETSGVSQVRNFGIFDLFDPNGCLVGQFVGRNKAGEYISDNNINASVSMIKRRGYSRGWTLVRHAPEAVTTIQ